MRRSRSAPLRFALLAAGVVGLAAQVPAQDVPRPVVSTKADESPTASPAEAVSGLLLRPNTELPFYVYVENPGKQAWKKLTVRVTADPKGKEVLAQGVVDALGKGETTPVRLRPAASAEPPPPLAPPAAPPAADKGQPATPKAPPGTPVTGPIWIHLLDDQGEPLPDSKPISLPVRMMRPTDYLHATPVVSTVGDRITLQVTLADRSTRTGAEGTKAPFRGPPATAKLDLRPGLVAGLDPASLKDGTFETVVAPGGKGVVLIARNLRFTAGARPREATIAVTADGYDRAFVFTTDFIGTTPTPFSQTAVRIDAPRYAVPGKPYSARLEVFNDPDQARPRLEFYRAEQGEPELVTANLRTPRNQATTLRIGQAGELILAAEVKDWVVPINTAGVYGTRRMVFSLDPAKPDEALVTLDDTPPENVRLLVVPPPPPPPRKRRVVGPAGASGTGAGAGAALVLPPGGGVCLPGAIGGPLMLAQPVEPPPPPPPPRLPGPIGKKWIRGTEIQLVARAEDPESGITGVLFFLNAPPGPDGKLPPGAKAVAGAVYVPPTPPTKDAPKVPPPAAITAWTGSFELPDVKGPVTLGVRFVNAAGLVSEETVEINLVDPPEPPKTGSIEGKVVQGTTSERPQPGLPVLLLDAGGKLVKSTVTTDTGTFEFQDLPPGAYVVYSVKAADYGARSFQPATVEAGETTVVQLELKR